MTKKRGDGSKLSKVELKWNICKVMFSGNVKGFLHLSLMYNQHRFLVIFINTTIIPCKRLVDYSMKLFRLKLVYLSQKKYQKVFERHWQTCIVQNRCWSSSIFKMNVVIFCWLFPKCFCWLYDHLVMDHRQLVFVWNCAGWQIFQTLQNF